LDSGNGEIFVKTLEVFSDHTVLVFLESPLLWVGVPSDDSTAVGRVGVPTVAGILAIVGLPSPVYVCDVPIAADHPTKNLNLIYSLPMF
jgi:hypothetical protein